MKRIIEIISVLLNKFAAQYSTKERPSPKNRIKRTDIVQDKETGTITVHGLKPDTWITTVQNTNSMDPVFDIGDYLFLEKVTNYSDLQEGDIIVYSAPALIIHRIISINIDTNGERNYTCRGDNCLLSDPYIIKDENVTHVYRGHLN